MDWSGVDYCDCFISCLDSHSDGTHSLQSKLYNAAFTQICSDEETNLLKCEYIFSKFLISGELLLLNTRKLFTL